MKNSLILLLIVVLSAFSSCTKESAETMECESQNIGYVTITNTSDNPYDIFKNDVYVFRLQGHTFEDDYELSVGSHTLKAVQASGYIVYPTIRETTINISQCEKLSWVFP